MRWSCSVIIVFLALLYGGTGIAFIAVVFPRVGETWDSAVANKIFGGDFLLIGNLLGACNVVSDLCLLALPIPIILKMNLSRKKKVGLCAVFMTAIM